MSFILNEGDLPLWLSKGFNQHDIQTNLRQRCKSAIKSVNGCSH